jgi:hypothetical protein
MLAIMRLFTCMRIVMGSFLDAVYLRLQLVVLAFQFRILFLQSYDLFPKLCILVFKVRATLGQVFYFLNQVSSLFHQVLSQASVVISEYLLFAQVGAKYLAQEGPYNSYQSGYYVAFPGHVFRTKLSLMKVRALKAPNMMEFGARGLLSLFCMGAFEVKITAPRYHHTNVASIQDNLRRCTVS